MNDLNHTGCQRSLSPRGMLATGVAGLASVSILTSATIQVLPAEEAQGQNGYGLPPVNSVPTVTTRDGVRIFYKDWGPRSAQPIFFHHGWPLTG